MGCASELRSLEEIARQWAADPELSPARDALLAMAATCAVEAENLERDLIAIRDGR
ncbi:hypothetical protein GCM10007858_07340 [Bradyrhizobium liaoningense]|nr:hypothetical protein GCM10007858_07340 [Bradyrhizobium liaoningense]